MLNGIQEKKRNFITIFLTIMIGNFVKGQKKIILTIIQINQDL